MTFHNGKISLWTPLPPDSHNASINGFEEKDDIEILKQQYSKSLQAAVLKENKNEIHEIIVSMHKDEIEPSYTCAVHLAAKSANTDILLTLLNYGFNIHTKNSEGDTALHVACQWGNKKSVEILLSAGSNMNITNERNCYPLDDLVYPFFRKDNLTALCTPINTTIPAQCRWILEVKTNMEILKLFISHGAKFDSTNPVGRRVVRNLICTNAEKCVELIAMTGYNISVVDKCGFTLLHDSICIGNYYASKELLRYIDVNCSSMSEMTPLHVAALKGWPDCMDLLLIHGAVIDPVDLLHETPICKVVYSLTPLSPMALERLVCGNPSLKHLLNYILDPSHRFHKLIQNHAKKRKILVEHILKMKAANVDPADPALITEFLNFALDPEFNTTKFLKDHVNEVQRMRKMMFASYISAYHFMTWHPDVVAWYLNEELRIFFESRAYEIKFPLYAKYFESVYKIALKRRERLEKGGPVISQILSELGLPDTFTRCVLNNLTGLSLERITE